MGIFITPLWSEYIVSADQGGIFMDHFNVYSDIQARTGGEIYIGVVGPVRTGKSTFIKRFMELLVLPGLEDVHARTSPVFGGENDHDNGTEIYP